MVRIVLCLSAMLCFGFYLMAGEEVIDLGVKAVAGHAVTSDSLGSSSKEVAFCGQCAKERQANRKSRRSLFEKQRQDRKSARDHRRASRGHGCAGRVAKPESVLPEAT